MRASGTFWPTVALSALGSLGALCSLRACCSCRACETAQAHQLAPLTIRLLKPNRRAVPLVLGGWPARTRRPRRSRDALEAFGAAGLHQVGNAVFVHIERSVSVIGRVGADSDLQPVREVVEVRVRHEVDPWPALPSRTSRPLRTPLPLGTGDALSALSALRTFLPGRTLSPA